jgi:phosphoglycolate phosphatase
VITLLVDLDGTITDPAPGMIGAFRFALERMGVTPPPKNDLHWIIGPPTRLSFPTFLRPDQDVEEAVRLYRERYGEGGLFEARVYDGMPDALQALRELPARLFVCTAKPPVFAVPILEHFGLTSVFTGIYGPDLEGRLDDKGLLIGRMLEAERIDPVRTVMIGDRANDVRAAARHGIPTVGALWGYGGREELTEAGAAVLCEAPYRLLASVTELMRAERARAIPRAG